MTSKIRNPKKMLTAKKRLKVVANPNRTITNSTNRTFRLFEFQTFDFREDSDNSSEDGSVVDNNKTKDAGLFRIQMFGINEKGETALIYVDGYKPFFYVKVSSSWTQKTADTFLQHLRKKVNPYYADSIKKAILVKQNKLYDFAGDTQFHFVQLQFANMVIFNKVKNLWYSNTQTETMTGEVSFKRTFRPYVFNSDALYLYESKIPPLLRYFHIHNISPSGWIEITDFEPIRDGPLSSCTYEFICTPKRILPLPQKETPVPYKICSFDIEASSSHGDFPLPQKDYKRLATQIVDEFSKRVDGGHVASTAHGEVLMKKMLSAAFGIGTMENIDLVYPKKKVSKEVLKQRFQHILKKSLKTLHDESSETKEQKSKVLKITNAFEKLANDAKTLTSMGTSNSSAAEGGEGDGENGDSTELLQDNVGGFGSGVGEVPENIPNYSKSQITVEKQCEDKSKSIVQILCSTEYNRENKIRIVNETLTADSVLPMLKGDEVTFIGSTFMKYGESEPYKNHCLVVGTCDSIPGADVVSVKTEKDCLLEWTALIQHENPDIIIGYNIFGFDYEFMFQRAQELGITEAFMMMSRITDEKCYKEQYSSKEKVLAQTKNRLASGDYDLRYPAISGRLQIDLLFYFRRDYNLASYKLDDVAGNFIRDDIKALVSTVQTCKRTSHEIPVTHIYSKNLAGLHVDDFIHLEITTFTVDYYQKGKKFRVLDIIHDVKVDEGHDTLPKGKYNIIVIAGHYHSDLDAKTQVLKWGMSKDDVSPQDIFRLSKESATSRAIVAKYCIQDCNLVQHLMKKTDVLTGYNEMSRICNVPISFLVFRGQGIKLTSYVAKVCREKNTLMPDLEHIPNDDGYEGAIVLPPKCAMYGENPVACNDYSSLYPSIAKAWNLSPNSKVWTKLFDLQGNLIRINDIPVTSTNRSTLEKQIAKYDNMSAYRYIQTEFDHFETVQKYTANGKLGRKVKTKAGKKVCRWAQFPNGHEGIIPCIIGDLLKARKDTRKKSESESDPFLANVLDKRQLGYKVTANSLYGQMGSSVSTFYEKDVAASITSIGRMMITYAKRMVEEIYGDMLYTTKDGKQCVKCRSAYVYGDTDSVFFTFNLEEADTGKPIRGKRALELTIEIAQEAAELCSLFLPPPMKLAYEKTLMSFILLSKKRYVGMLYETDPNKGKLKFMGLPLKRRDSCDYVKDVYGGILTILMKEPDNIQKAIEFLNSMLTRLVKGEVSMEKLAITKSLRSEYKNPKQIAHRVLADRMGERDPGNKPKPGDRIKYIFVQNPDKNSLLGERIETPDYIVQNKVPLDYTYYITNQLMNPLQQLLGLALEKIYECKTKSQQDLIKYRSFVEELYKSCTPNDKSSEVDLELFMKKREKYCSNQVKQLLFDPFLTDLYNQQNGIQTLFQFYKKRI
jgi:DNA polymerase elongation subunit (family B)